MINRLLAIAAATVLCLTIALIWPSAAAAQIVALVNGDPITVLDIAKNRLTEISAHKQQSRDEALNELINEKLKLQVAKRYIINITDKDVDTAFGSMAHGAGLSAQEFSDELTNAGISVPALKGRVKADIGWGAIIRGKFQGSLQVGDKEVREAIRTRNKDDKPAAPMFQFKLQQVLFIVPRRAPDTVYEARLKEAEALRARFEDCDQGIAMARAIRDVTVRNPINRSSMDVPVKRRESLDNTPVGHLTPPEITQFGVETFAICSKEEIHGDAPEEREVREEIAAQRFEAQSKRYLEELRRSAMIELR